MTTITVERVEGSSGAVSVNYNRSDATATNGLDYTGVNGTLNWANGVTTDRTFDVPILDDALPEGDETVILTLSNPGGGAVLQQPNPTALIIQDDEQPSPQPGPGPSSESIPTLDWWGLLALELLLSWLGIRHLGVQRETK